MRFARPWASVSTMHMHTAFSKCREHLCGVAGCALAQRSLPAEFESLHWHIWKVFHLWVRFFNYGSRSVHLVYLVHKSVRKTPIIISECRSMMPGYFSFVLYGDVSCPRRWSVPKCCRFIAASVHVVGYSAQVVSKRNVAHWKMKNASNLPRHGFELRP